MKEYEVFLTLYFIIRRANECDKWCKKFNCTGETIRQIADKMIEFLEQYNESELIEILKVVIPKNKKEKLLEMLGRMKSVIGAKAFDVLCNLHHLVDNPKDKTELSQIYQCTEENIRQVAHAAENKIREILARKAEYDRYFRKSFGLKK